MFTYNLRYFLSSMSKQVLLSIYKELSPLGVIRDVESTEENELRKGLLELANNKELAKQIYTSLSTVELEVLHYFIFHIGEELLSYRQIDRSLEGIKPATFRLGLTKLRRKGFIYTVRRQWGEIFYVLPVDLSQLYYQIYVEQQEVDIIVGEGDPPSTHRQVDAARKSILVDIFLLLDNIRMENGASIPLTKRGGIHKKYINQWQVFLSDREEDLHALSLQVEDPYTKYIALLIDFLTSQKIIIWYEDRLQLDLDQAALWMERSREEMRSTFLEFWYHTVKPSTPWLNRFLKDILAIQDRKWRSSFSLVEVWEEQYSLPGIQQIRQMLLEEVLQPLHGFGLLELGSTEQGEDIWCWRQEQDGEGEGWLQPTLELFTPSFISFSHLWKLTLLFSVDRWEEMLVVKLSREKIRVQLQHGIDLKEWQHWLGQFCTSSIPAAFLDQLLQAQKELQQAKAMDVTLIELSDTALVEAIMKWPEIKKLEAKYVGEHFISVPFAHKDQFFSILEKKGINVLQQQKENSASKVKEEKKLLTSASKERVSFKVESIFPNLEEAIPDWNLWPEIWKKNLSTYHLQTKKDILEKAIQYDIRIRFQWKDGSISEMIPSRCLIEHGRWMCYDQKQKSYDIEDMQKLQMIFPFE